MKFFATKCEESFFCDHLRSIVKIILFFLLTFFLKACNSYSPFSRGQI